MLSLSPPLSLSVSFVGRHSHQLQCARERSGRAQYDAYIQKYDHRCGDPHSAAGQPHHGRHLLHSRGGGHTRGRRSLQQAGCAAHRCADPIAGHRLHTVSEWVHWVHGVLYCVTSSSFDWQAQWLKQPHSHQSINSKRQWPAGQADRPRELSIKLSLAKARTS